MSLDPSTLLLIKTNLTFLNIVSAMISFFIGISPLFMERKDIVRQNTPFWVELSAVSFLVFTLFMFSLDFFASIPLFNNQQCLRFKNSYLTKLEFVEYYPRDKKIRIQITGDSNYLVKNLKTAEMYELPIKDDYQYQKESCE